MSEQSSVDGTNSVPTSALMDWHNNERSELIGLNAKLRAAQQDATQNTAKHSAAELLEIRVRERTELLQSFAAFVMVESADAAGQLEVPTPEEL